MLHSNENKEPTEFELTRKLLLFNYWWAQQMAKKEAMESSREESRTYSQRKMFSCEAYAKLSIAFEISRGASINYGNPSCQGNERRLPSRRHELLQMTSSLLLPSRRLSRMLILDLRKFPFAPTLAKDFLLFQRWFMNTEACSMNKLLFERFSNFWIRH